MYVAFAVGRDSDSGRDRGRGRDRGPNRSHVSFVLHRRSSCRDVGRVLDADVDAGQMWCWGMEE